MPSSIAALTRLLEDADVVVENFRPGAAEKLGLKWDDLHDRHPKLISCSISGYGQTGSMKSMPAIEWSVQSVSGMADSYLGPSTDALDLGIGMLDPFTGYAAFSGILAALLSRAKDGRGRRLDVSMLDAALALASGNVTASLLGGPASHGRRAAMGRYMAGDRRIFIAALTPAWFERLCQVISAPEIATDPLFSTHKAREENAQAFVDAVEARLKEKNAFEWEELLVAAGVPAGASRSMAEIAQSQHMASRSLWALVESEHGPVPVVGSAFLIEGEERVALGPVPSLGEHTAQVLAEIGVDFE